MVFPKRRNVMGITSGHINLTWTTFFPSRYCSAIKNNCFESLILKNTVISRNHLTPELKLRLITPECELWHCKDTESPFTNDPFWGFYWPGGQALGRYILDNQKFFQNKNILDIGSGSGACALAAAKSDAKFVLANDIDPVSIEAIKINSELNNLKVYTCSEDLIGKDIDSFIVRTDKMQLKLNWDVILVGDLFYDAEFSNKLFFWLLSLVIKNKLVLIGDPGRFGLKQLDSLKEFGTVVKIIEYPCCNKEHNGILTSAVFKIEPKKSSF